MNKITRGRFLSSAAPLLGIASTRLSGQSGDTPIIITDGSLKMRSGARWADFGKETAKRRRHPRNGQRVERVDVELAGASTSVLFNGQECEVRVTYAGTDIVVSTNPSGRNLKIETDWDAFKEGPTENDIEHSNASSHISRVIVKRNGTVVADASPNGGTKVTISYR